MLARGGGKIVFIASLLSFQGGINVPGYAAARRASPQLTKALANEWAAHGVNVNAIAPGYVAHRQHAGAPGRRDAPRQILERIPAGRWGGAGGRRRRGRLPRARRRRLRHGDVLPVDGGWLGR